MELGKHLSKGFWGIADKSLPLLYGVGFVLIVIRTLPTEEFGTYILVQNLFLLIVAAGSSFAMQPMLKYAAETNEIEDIVSTGFWMYVFLVISLSICIALCKEFFTSILRAPTFTLLAWYLPLMAAVSLLRTVVIYLLQSKFKIAQIFWINAVYYIGSIALIAILFRTIHFQTAEMMMRINTITLALSSLLAAVFVVYSFPASIIKNFLIVRIKKKTLIKFWHYGKYSFGATSLYTYYTQADSYIVSFFLGPTAVAPLNAAKVFTRIYDAVLQMCFTFLVPASSRLAAQQDEKNLSALAEKSIFFLTVSTIFISVALCTGAPYLFSLMYQQKYSASVAFLQILSLSGFFVPLLGISASFLAGIGRVKEFFLATLLNTIVAIIVYAFASYFFGITGIVVASVFLTAFLTFSYAYTMVRWGKVSIRWAHIVLRYRDALDFLKKSYTKNHSIPKS
jgi:O-antigen/teichoic acid export membrane protein